jgi:hypothetical protein
LHANLEPGFDEENLKLGVGLLVGSVGPPVILVFGGAALTAKLRNAELLLALTKECVAGREGSVRIEAEAEGARAKSRPRASSGMLMGGRRGSSARSGAAPRQSEAGVRRRARRYLRRI